MDYISQKLSHIEPWACIDLEINPETNQLVKAAILNKQKDKPPSLSTTSNPKAFFGAFENLVISDAVVIGHNLRRHDLKWIADRRKSSLNLKYCIDTLELYPIVYPSAKSHALEKAYKDPRRDDPMLRKGKPHPNHPALDCQTTMELLVDILEQFDKIRREKPALFDAYNVLLSQGGAYAKGIHRLLGSQAIELEPYIAFENALVGSFCVNAIETVKKEPITEARARSLAYFLSLMPDNPESKPLSPRPWVRFQHPEVVRLIKQLRGTNCADFENCEYCRQNFDTLNQMHKLFDFPGWRNEGQKTVTEAVLKGENVIGVLPTSGGKSLTFQLPAFINANTTGALTVVISPLISLMNDQVDTLVHKVGRDDVCQLNSSLNSLERTRNLRRIRGEKSTRSDEQVNPCHIVYMAPEQLRSMSAINAISARGIGLLVIDEAHCMAKWGKDFRVDYRFIPELISRLCKKSGIPIPPVLCLTATARKDILAEISERFRDGLNVKTKIIDAGHARENLEFECIYFEESEGERKYAELKPLVEREYMQNHAVLVFCSTRRRTEELAQRLRNDGITQVDHYHGGCESEHRTSVQDRFLRGDLQVVVATNAFGMGVDKKDIRLLIHYDVPGSIEDYVQESGRAGRDNQKSKCVLFYDPTDLDTQLDMRRRNHLRRHELRQIVLELRYRCRQKEKHGDPDPEITISARDLLRGKTREEESESGDEQPGSRMTYIDDPDTDLYTKVTTALGILEEGKHLSRHENVFQFIPAPMRIKLWEDIRKTIYAANLPENIQTLLANMAEFLFNRSVEKGEQNPVDVEELADNFLIEREKVSDHIEQLRSLGVCHRGVEYTIDWDRQTSFASSIDRFNIRLKLLQFLVDWFKHSELDFGGSKEEQDVDLMRIITASKSVDGYGYSTSDLNKDLSFLSNCGLFMIVRHQKGKIFIIWKSDIREIDGFINQKQDICGILLDYFNRTQTEKGHVTNKFNFSAFERWLSGQIINQSPPSEPECEDGLLFMHERDIVKVVNGFSLLRSRMKIHPDPERIKQSYDSAFKEYEIYTKSTIAQIKVMEKYSGLLVKDKDRSERYLSDYFSLEWDSFKIKYFDTNEIKNLEIPVRREQIHSYFGTLTKSQKEAVEAKTSANHLVIAGPGSGKTHILVLRLFQLVKVRQVPARCIAVLAYNRHAAIEIKRRLKVLLPRDYFNVHVHTFHGLALKLVGRDRLNELQNDSSVRDIFDQLLSELIQHLDSTSGDDEHAQLRWLDRLLGIEYMLVDEFQDISEKEYEILKRLSRLNASNKDCRVHVMAVGDDDQNLYAFRGSSVKWIRQFEKDFEVKKRMNLIHNFRSIPSILEVSGRFISQNSDRLKEKDWIQEIPESNKIWIDDQIKRDPDKGKVVHLKLGCIVETRIAIVEEINAIRRSYPVIKLGDICIAHSTNSEACLTKEILEKRGLPTALLGDHKFARRYERGVIEIVRQLEELDPEKSTISFKELGARVTKCYTNTGIDISWRDSWDNFIDEKSYDVSASYNMSVKQMLGRIDEYFMSRAGELVPEDKIASITLHKTKGLQFHTVFLFPPNLKSDIEELRRLYFVGLTRAKVKAFLIDWKGCDYSFWDEMSHLANSSITERHPVDSTHNVLAKMSDSDLNLINEFSYFDTYKLGLGTGMNIYFVGDQTAIKSLKRNQLIGTRFGKTKSGNEKDKIEFVIDDNVIGMLKYAAVAKLLQEIAGDPSRIIRVEVAQIALTDTEPEKRHYNNQDMHYYIIPRIFYRKTKPDWIS